MAVAWGDEHTVVVAGRPLRLTNPQRPLFPDGFTKGELIAYYRAVAPAMLPHLAERPVTLRRFPEGVWAHGWYQTECRAFPPWLPTQEVGYTAAPPQRYCVISEEAALVWAANLAAIELHPLLAVRARLDEPLAAVVDLDPGEPAGLRECARVALLVREALGALGLVAFVKTSGSLGLHVFVPLNGAHTFEQSKSFVRALHAHLADEHPALVVASSRRSERGGRVYLDWAQNNASRSTVAPYSVRVGWAPAVSLPLTWDEVDALASGAPPPPQSPRDALARLDAHGDLFAPVLTTVQALP